MSVRVSAIARRFFISVVAVFVYCACSFFTFVQPANAARATAPELGALECYSSGQRLFSGTTVGEPNADEYFRALEFRIQEKPGEPLRQINVSGGLCAHVRAPLPAPKVTEVTNRLVCFSGGTPVLKFVVIGRESSDEYKGGRRFIAQIDETYAAVTIYGDGGLCLGDEGLLR
jgi:hypothetical protein